MDPALKKQHDVFKKKASSMPTVEAKQTKRSVESSKPRPTKKTKTETSAKPHEFDYKAVAAPTDNKFAVLARVVKYLKSRHQEGGSEAIHIKDILDETNLLSLAPRIEHWLITEALTNNPKVEVIKEGMYKFRPIYDIRDRKGLLSLLSQNYDRGYGGVLAEEAEESLPNFAKAIKVLGDQIFTVARPSDKKQVLFYNDKSVALPVDEEIKKLWRSVTVEGVDERKIEDYLQKHNIVAMPDLAVKKSSSQKRKKAVSKKLKPFKTHNEHLGDILQDYSEKQT